MDGAPLKSLGPALHPALGALEGIEITATSVNEPELKLDGTDVSALVSVATSTSATTAAKSAYFAIKSIQGDSPI
jgi:hypothetical protein